MKKIKYQITRKKYQYVEVENEEQEELIIELNREFERIDKQEKSSRTRNISIDYLNEVGSFEVVDEKENILDRLLKEEEVSLFNQTIHQAINQLTSRQKAMVIMIYFENKTQNEVAEHFGITKSAVSHAMDRIYHTLRKYLEKK